MALLRSIYCFMTPLDGIINHTLRILMDIPIPQRVHTLLLTIRGKPSLVCTALVIIGRITTGKMPTKIYLIILRRQMITPGPGAKTAWLVQRCANRWKHSGAPRLAAHTTVVGTAYIYGTLVVCCSSRCSVLWLPFLQAAIRIVQVV